MSVIQRSVCCVDYLDIDVSKYIYETYTPSDRAREWKSLLNDQYKYHLNGYPKNDILKDNIERYRQQNGLWRSRKINFLTYLLKHHKSGPIYRDGSQNYLRDPWGVVKPSRNRAIQYKREAKRYRTLGSHYY